MPADSSSTHIPRSTPALIAELRMHAAGLTLAAIAVVDKDSTQFVFPTDDDPLSRLNTLIHAGGHPIGIVGAQIGHGAIKFVLHPFIEFQNKPQALEYLHTLRDPFLTLIRTHVDRMPDNPRNNQYRYSSVVADRLRRWDRLLRQVSSPPPEDHLVPVRRPDAICLSAWHPVIRKDHGITPPPSGQAIFVMEATQNRSGYDLGISWKAIAPENGGTGRWAGWPAMRAAYDWFAGG